MPWTQLGEAQALCGGCGGRCAESRAAQPPSTTTFKTHLRYSRFPAPSAIPLPPTDYPLFDALPPELVSGGKLSQLQVRG